MLRSSVDDDRNNEKPPREHSEEAFRRISPHACYTVLDELISEAVNLESHNIEKNLRSFASSSEASEN